MAQNLAEMGLAEDPNKAVPIPKKKLLVSVAVARRGRTGQGGSAGAAPLGGVRGHAPPPQDRLGKSSVESSLPWSVGQVALDQSL